MESAAATITRRHVLGATTALALAGPTRARAQPPGPIRIGVLSDVAGPYRNVGGPGGKIAVEMAAEDFGGSLLGRPIEVVQADIQNKPDLASAKAREWIDAGFSLLVDGGATSSGLAIQEVSRAKKVIYLGNGPSATDFTGKFCSPYGFHFWADTYSLAKGTGETLTRSGGTTWFFITADYQFGYSLQANTERFVKDAGGSVLGAVRVPLGTADFSSALLAGPDIRRQGRRLRQRRHRPAELHQAGGGVRYRQRRADVWRRCCCSSPTWLRSARAFVRGWC